MDCCARFDVEDFQILLKTYGRELVIINKVKEGQVDLMQNFLAIITVFRTLFCARLYGRRRGRHTGVHVLAAVEVT